MYCCSFFTNFVFSYWIYMEKGNFIAIDNLKEKIVILISKYEEQKSINNDLSKILTQYREQIEQNNNIIKEQKEQIEKLQLIGIIETSISDGKLAKQRVKKMINEIDKCVGKIMVDNK